MRKHGRQSNVHTLDISAPDVYFMSLVELFGRSSSPSGLRILF